MRIATDIFMEKYTELFIARAPYIATLAYWKMKHLIEDGETFYIEKYDCYYMIRDKHLLVYYSPDNKMHIDIDVLNDLNCISLPADMYDSIKSQLVGFDDSRNWGLRYDFNYQAPQQKTYNE